MPTTVPINTRKKRTIQRTFSLLRFPSARNRFHKRTHACSALICAILLASTPLPFPAEADITDTAISGQRYHIIADHVELYNVHYGGLRSLSSPKGQKDALALLSSRIYITNLKVVFLHDVGYRGIIDASNAVSVLSQTSSHSAELDTDGLTADFSVAGHYLGRWTIDLKGFPIGLLRALDLPNDLAIGQKIVDLLSLDNIDVNTYRIIGKITLPHVDITPITPE